MAGLLNKKAVKNYILKRVQSDRPGWKCTQVSRKAIDDIEAFLSNRIFRAVQQHPTKGKTFIYFD